VVRRESDYNSPGKPINPGSELMKNTDLARLIAAPLMVLALSLPAWAADSTAATTCKDGTTSTATGRGACSGHGGVQKTSKSTAAAPAAAATTPTVAKPAPAAAPAPATAAPATAAPATAAPAQAKSSTASKSVPTATAGNTDPTGATAKCKDGTYSKSQHRSGTCSKHGGVADWLTPAK
jgi:hypothetical protein